MSFTKFGLDFTQAARQSIPSCVKQKELNSYCAQAGNRIFQGLWTVLPVENFSLVYMLTLQGQGKLFLEFIHPVHTSQPVALRPSIWGVHFLSAS